MASTDDINDMDTLINSSTIVPLKGADENGEISFIPALILQSHPQLQRAGEVAWLTGLEQGKPVQLGRNFPDFMPIGDAIGQPISDPYISRSPIQLTMSKDGAIDIDLTQTSTQVKVNGETATGVLTLPPQSVAHGVVLELANRVCLLLKILRYGDNYGPEDFAMVGVSSSLSAVRSQLQRLEGVSEPVLIRGATGVGKELVAQAIVDNSDRRNKPYITLNLGAIPESLAAAELFGTQKGAFTGADKNRDGYFMAANGGTLFLDEIGEASPEVQAMLLRVLETGELYAVGSDTPKKVDVRLIAATDADLENKTGTRPFKQPLLHRLAAYDIRLVDLHERREDIGMLFWHFARQQLLKMQDELPQMSPGNATVWMPSALMRLLLEFDWPGNIRQLRNVAQQLVIDSRDRNQLMAREHLMEMLDIKPQTTQALASKEKRRKPNTITEEELAQALEAKNWELQAAADYLRISRASVYELMSRFGIATGSDIDADEIRQCYERHNGDIAAMVNDLKMSKHAIRRRVNELGLL